MTAATAWTCPTCQRRFTRPNQRHACGTGDADVLRGRPQHLVDLYAALTQYVRSLGDVELVTRDRYVLLRTTRIFADLVVMKDALRLAIHLTREVEDPLIIKTVRDRHQVTHVVLLREPSQLERVQPWLLEAHARTLA